MNYYVDAMYRGYNIKHNRDGYYYVYDKHNLLVMKYTDEKYYLNDIRDEIDNIISENE